MKCTSQWMYGRIRIYIGMYVHVFYQNLVTTNYMYYCS